MLAHVSSVYQDFYILSPALHTPLAFKVPHGVAIYTIMAFQAFYKGAKTASPDFTILALLAIFPGAKGLIVNTAAHGVTTGTSNIWYSSISQSRSSSDFIILAINSGFLSLFSSSIVHLGIIFTSF